MDCSDSDDAALLTAVHKLETIAGQNSFTIHDVPYDGNCMFSAILHISWTVLAYDSNTLRHTVADYLGANRASYCDFVCQPVAQKDADNLENVIAESESSSDDEEFLAAVTVAGVQQLETIYTCINCKKGIL